MPRKTSLQRARRQRDQQAAAVNRHKEHSRVTTVALALLVYRLAQAANNMTEADADLLARVVASQFTREQIGQLLAVAEHQLGVDADE